MVEKKGVVGNEVRKGANYHIRKDLYSMKNNFFSNHLVDIQFPSFLLTLILIYFKLHLHLYSYYKIANSVRIGLDLTRGNFVPLRNI